MPFLLTVIGFVRSHQGEERACRSLAGKRCFQWKLYQVPAKAIKPNNKVSELDPAMLFEGDLFGFGFIT